MTMHPLTQLASQPEGRSSWHLTHLNSLT